MNEMERLWDYVKQHFRQELSKGSYETWIQALDPIEFSGQVLHIRVPSELHKKHIENYYLLTIKQVIYEFLNQEVDVLLHLDQPNNRIQMGNQGQADTEIITNPSKDLLNPKYTFDNFIVGEGNKMAHAAALAVAEGPGRDYNPLFFFGGVGLGKTHLMQAIGHEVLRTNPNARVKYVTSETFTNDFINAIRTNTTDQFHKDYRTVDMLLVDDIQFIGGNKQSTQEEFFHTFNALYNNNKHIVLTSDRDASQIPELEDRLVSRFKQGLSTDITPPDLETRIAILRNKANVNGLQIPDDTLSYIAGQIDSNIRELEGALTSVQAYAVMNQEDLTPNTAAKALRSYRSNAAKSAPSIADIQNTVAQYFNLEVADLKGKKRVRSIVVPRQIAMYLSREVTESSLPKIGQEFGGKDHTTVLHAHEKIADLIQENGEVSRDVESIKKLLQK
ncbi:chromosomal replication initiator protein DnaA [Aerococcus kribbianus]|uniref:Chromosomal replication initiator protein DnaA n=1 Tax=Aerococcus kribbianus TaxID=2999064 RepID=A0A9X3FPH1_9LACT|nr:MULTISPECIES: chromosomal replication initiator protein DnaA [unclassified Aerococcus]MCZ0717578.1 chromosomal replication initiator protein DnaA [Aerococcus sp. YH-aer221]MCZ0725866.1 chromosomal replication initiator protein DnaA [Aerococcus sp. YH-aer222]